MTAPGRIACIHVAKKQLGLDDDTYRAKLRLIVGKESTRDMSEAERQKVLDAFRKDGFKPASNRRRDGRTKLSGPYAAKLQALWIAGWNLGIFRERDDSALIAFVKRQTGLDAVQFLRFPDDARKAIEALKAILAREGGVDWSKNRFSPPEFDKDGHRIAAAQWRKLYGNSGGFWGYVFRLLGRDDHVVTDKDWITVMNALGKRIRDEQVTK